MSNTHNEIHLLNSDGSTTPYGSTGGGGGTGPAAGSIVISKNNVPVTSLPLNNGETSAVLDANITSDASFSQIQITTNPTGVVTAVLSASKDSLTITGVAGGTAQVKITTPATSAYTNAEYQFEVVSDMFVPEAGQSFKLGSGAHTGGTADLECVVLDNLDDTHALCITKGLYGSGFPGTGSLDSIKGTYFGDLASAVSNLYLPRIQGGSTDPTTTTPTGVSVYDGSAWSDDYSTNAKSALVAAATNYQNLDAAGALAMLGAYYSSTACWEVRANGNFDMSTISAIETSHHVVAPTFILDLTKVKLSGDTIVRIQDIAPTVPAWMATATVNKPYVSLSDVFADGAALNALMADEDAVDYLADATDWASATCADESAMSYIGLNNYAANTLLADSTWLDAIANSSYMESVMNVKVPVMTSYTTPSGEVNQLDNFNNYYSWTAFDGKTTGDIGFVPPFQSDGVYNVRLWYRFTSAVQVKMAFIHRYNNDSNSNGELTYDLCYSDNGTDWTSFVVDSTLAGNQSDSKLITSNLGNHNYWGIYMKTMGYGTGGQNRYATLGELQFYGREDV